MNWKRVVFLCCGVLVALSLAGCAATPKVLLSNENGPRKLVVFFDGTANDESSDTNIKKLQSLVSLQKKHEISTFYVEGVGANSKVVGMATGWGIGHRVRLAYQYLATNYRDGDEIYLFGFSRGSYSARILASMLHYAGLPGHQLPDVQLIDMTDRIYDAFKGSLTGAQRQTNVLKTLADNKLPSLKHVDVTFMGLWDTVEALGLPDYKEDIDMPNNRYGDQLCNVKRAAHVLALDDDRARIFTPILLTQKHLLAECIADANAIPDLKKRLDATVEEVWFSGAHADVGGGYINSLLSGVSLNWMMGQLKSTGLLPTGAAVPENLLEKTHDPESGLLWGALYHEMPRNLSRYAEDSIYNGSKLKVHQSVIDRLAHHKPEFHEYQWMQSSRFALCFQELASAYKYTPSEKCMLDVVN